MNVAAITAALKTRGFAPAPPRSNGIACYAGSITCHGEPIPVELEILDLDFIALPKVRLLRRPAKLIGWQPHFGANDELCYADKNEAHLDRYRPAESVVGCLERAQRLIEDLSAKKRPADDTGDEFAAYWHGTPVFLDLPIAYSGTAAINLMAMPGQSDRVLLASISPRETAKRLAAINWKSLSDHQANCVIIRTSRAPNVDRQNWPLRTLEQVANWLKRLDPAAYKIFHRALASAWIVRCVLAGFIIRTPAGDFGFSLEIDAIHALSYRRKPSLLRDYLLHKASKLSIGLLLGYRIDQEYIHSRNTSSSLRNKVIVVAGCGTVGGYLASFLARLGAGSGQRGRLVLADPDVLTPGNLGRHLLGLDDLLRNKATAMAEVLSRQFPFSTIEARPVDVRETKEFLTADVLVDVTGEEALSAAINEDYLVRRLEGKKAPAALYSWIAGAGVAVQGLLVDSLKTACFRCMRVLEANGELVVRFSPIREGGAEVKRIGCESYMPFPVTASARGAVLATQMLEDWCNGRPSPRLRTEILDRPMSKAVKDQDPTPLDSCPACRRR